MPQLLRFPSSVSIQFQEKVIEELILLDGTPAFEQDIAVNYCLKSSLHIDQINNLIFNANYGSN